MEKNDFIEVTVTDQADDGQGIGHIDGMAVFVGGAVCGDRVLARVTKAKKNYVIAEAEEILEPSPHRAEDVCPFLAECGGCTYGAIDYEMQLALKEEHLKQKLIRLGKLTDPLVRPIIGMEEPYHYRNKGVFTVSGRYVGFNRRGSHFVFDCRECRLQAPPAMAVAEAVRGWMEAANVKGYDERTGRGLLKQLTVKTSFTTGEVMAVLDVDRGGLGKGDAYAGLPKAEDLIYAMDDAVNALPAEEGGPDYSLESVALTWTKENGDTVTRILAGKRTIDDVFCGMTFEISPQSFYQVNPVQTERLYGLVRQYAGIKGGETVLDLYCGVGTIGLTLAAAGAGMVHGIEVVKEAVISANRNAVVNRIVNALYYTGRAEEVLPGLGIGHADVAILDPPRKGCDESLLRTVAEAGPDRIVYVSCDPATLSRDIAILDELGYRFVEATPVDMFCHTAHVETVCALSKLSEAKHHISVQVDMDELDVTAAESKATYEEIQEWVQEKYGFHVTHLNIAKTKRKCGIIERQNYNLPKSEDSRSPETPKEKEEAIVAAFKAFQMI